VDVSRTRSLANGTPGGLFEEWRRTRPCADRIGDVSHDHPGRLRRAHVEDAAALLSLWDFMFEEMDSPASSAWREHALAWFAKYVDDAGAARIPVIDVSGQVVASAVGTVETGVPNPLSPTGRGVRLVNVITLPPYRGRGYATELIGDVVGWAQDLAVDRIDLSATPQGQRIYERLGFTLASAPRMKRIL
jgi:GNAT superfamily N-acetyltransferase